MTSAFAYEKNHHGFGHSWRDLRSAQRADPDNIDAQPYHPDWIVRAKASLGTLCKRIGETPYQAFVAGLPDSVDKLTPQGWAMLCKQAAESTEKDPAKLVALVAPVTPTEEGAQ